MSKTRKFITRLKPTHPLVENRYVHGRISAVFRLICDPIGHVSMYGRWYLPMKKEDGVRFEIETTEKRYAKAKEIIENWHPGLCEFDCKLEEEM